MVFAYYDIGLLVIFAIFLSFFLYTRRKNLKREGLLYLYRTSWGIKLIEIVGKKYKKSLEIFSYISIGLGYILMVSMLYLFGKIIYLYLFNQDLVRTIKVPPIMPLVPYLPQIFKLDFLPPFYFAYWIIILAIIAITHEFAHGIFAAYNKVKVKTTGFGFFPFFLPIFLAAFVELDEKVMQKKPIKKQLAILAAGTLANILTAAIFLVILWFFFSLTFSASGVIYDTYSYSEVQINTINSINNIAISNISYSKIIELSNFSKNVKLGTSDKNYTIPYSGLIKQNPESDYLILFDDAPAINSEMDAIIMEIDGIKINNVETLREVLSKYSPGDEITIKTKGEEIKEQKLILGENPDMKGSSFLGIGFFDSGKSGFMNKFLTIVSSFKSTNTYYESKSGELGIFVYNLLWWLVLISLSVALVNMLPMGIFDGGRFFYLTILAITKNDNLSRKIFSFMTYFLLSLVVVIMLFWFFSFLK